MVVERSVLVVLPVRLGSRRVPRKALVQIGGLPLVEHVRRRALLADVGPVVVAADDPEVVDVVRAHGGAAVLTGEHPDGTHRVAAIAARCAVPFVLNVQADQPLLDPGTVRVLADVLCRTGRITTLAAPWPEGIERSDRHVVKVWVRRGWAVDFSRDARRPGALRHLGLYGFPRERLLRVTSIPVGARARAEGLEQLTWLDAGFPIAVERVERASLPVDSPEQLARVRQILR